MGSEAETSDNPKVVAFVISLTHLGDEASRWASNSNIRRTASRVSNEPFLIMAWVILFIW